jgi:hypothetical protein
MSSKRQLLLLSRELLSHPYFRVVREPSTDISVPSVEMSTFSIHTKQNCSRTFYRFLCSNSRDLLLLKCNWIRSMSSTLCPCSSSSQWSVFVWWIDILVLHGWKCDQNHTPYTFISRYEYKRTFQNNETLVMYIREVLWVPMIHTHEADIIRIFSLPWCRYGCCSSLPSSAALLSGMKNRACNWSHTCW